MLEIFAPPPYRCGHDHDSLHRRSHPRFPASSPCLAGTRAYCPSTSSECPAATAPRSASALLHGPAPLGVALPSLAAGPHRHGAGQTGNRGPVASQVLPGVLVLEQTTP